MKTAFLTLALLAFWVLPFGCASLLPEPRVEDAVRSGAIWPGLQLSDLKKGRKLYVESCARCHALHLPSHLETAQWERIMVKMQLKAKIDDPTKDNIMKYLLTFAKDANSH